MSKIKSTRETLIEALDVTIAEQKGLLWDAVNKLPTTNYTNTIESLEAVVQCGQAASEIIHLTKSLALLRKRV